MRTTGVYRLELLSACERPGVVMAACPIYLCPLFYAKRMWLPVFEYDEHCRFSRTSSLCDIVVYLASTVERMPSACRHAREGATAVGSERLSQLNREDLLGTEARVSL